jgi:hypothetical protein
MTELEKNKLTEKFKNIKFQKSYTYEKPLKILDWMYNPYFRRYTALCLFKNGDKTWTFPERKFIDVHTIQGDLFQKNASLDGRPTPETILKGGK